MTTAVTAAQIAELRRMVAEPTATTYSDALLTTVIESYPTIDGTGQMPYYWSTALPPVQTANPYWVATFDLAAAAAHVWTEKAAVPAADFDFSADGASHSRSQVFEQALKMSRFYAAKRQASTITLHPGDSNLYRPDRPEVV